LRLNMANEEKSETKPYSFLIVGSGPAGIHAAVQAAKLGKKVAVIESHSNNLGGAWIHTGTLPSKTLRETGEAIQNLKFHAGEQWLRRLQETLSADRIYQRMRQVAGLEESLVRKHLESNNVEIVQGRAVLEDQHTLRVVDAKGRVRLMAGEHILLATGSRPRRPDDIPFDGWRVIDSDEILRLDHIPQKMIIYGAGVIGCEYACIFAALGTNVVIVDARTEILRGQDRELVAQLQLAMESLGISFSLGHSFGALNVTDTGVSVEVGGKTLDGDLIFFAAGRVSNTERLGLEKVDIQINSRGAIDVDEHFRTSVANIYAVGDVIGAPALAATSAEQGRHAVCHAFGACRSSFPDFFPIGIYTIPELSSVGLTEEQAVAEGREFVVGRANFDEVARGHIRGDDFGLLKLIVSKEDQRILGLHIVGPDAANLIHIGQAFMLADRPLQDLIDRMIFNYPTLAEAYRVAAFNALNKIFVGGSWRVSDGDSCNVTPRKMA